MSLKLVLGVLIVAAPAAAHAQFVDRTIVVAPPTPTAPVPTPGAAETQATSEAEPGFEARLTLSSFLYREQGDPGPAMIAGGEPPASSSATRRFFADVRGELTARRLGGGVLRIDARIRQATARAQSGEVGGDEYELRTGAYQRGFGALSLTLGRQQLDALAATRIDGAAATARLSTRWRATGFVGAHPQRGSRSLARDYPRLRTTDGSVGARLIPIAAGVGVSYRRPLWYGDLGAIGVIAPDPGPGFPAGVARRALVVAAGYWRPRPAIDIYHHGQLDLLGASGAHVSEASLGVDAWATSTLTITLAGHHVDRDGYELALANQLADPDPALAGQIDNRTQLVRVAQDAARVTGTLAAAQRRWQFTLGAGLVRRPATTVATADGNPYTFPAAATTELTVAVLDRRAAGGLRVGATATVAAPIASPDATRTRALAARLTVSRERPDLDLAFDLGGHHATDLGPGAGCAMLDPNACYGTAISRGVDGGVTIAAHTGRDWLVLLDGHGGVRVVDSTFANQSLAWPRQGWAAGFVRLQWRYR